MAAAILSWAFSAIQPGVSYDLPIFTLPSMTDSAALAYPAASGLVGSPVILTIRPPLALSPMPLRRASP